MPVAVAADERSLFHLPGAKDVRMQVIERQPGETNWPFTVDRGYLTCVFSLGKRIVMFGTIPDDSGDDGAEEAPRMLVISNNPIDLIFANLANRDLMRQQGDPAAVVSAFAPLFAAGKRLCDQPRGEVLGPGEL